VNLRLELVTVPVSDVDRLAEQLRCGAGKAGRGHCRRHVPCTAPPRWVLHQSGPVASTLGTGHRLSLHLFPSVQADGGCRRWDRSRTRSQVRSAHHSGSSSIKGSSAGQHVVEHGPARQLAGRCLWSQTLSSRYRRRPNPSGGEASSSRGHCIGPGAVGCSERVSASDKPATLACGVLRPRRAGRRPRCQLRPVEPGGLSAAGSAFGRLGVVAQNDDEGWSRHSPCVSTPTVLDHRHHGAWSA